MKHARLYCFLFLVQTAGLAIILWRGIPVYRLIVAGVPGQHAGAGTLILAALAVAMIQAAYWSRVRRIRSLDVAPNVYLSHVVLFAGRLSFIFGATFFAAVMYNRFPDLEKSIPRIVVLVAVLFSIFCYSLELEWLASQFAERSK